MISQRYRFHGHSSLQYVHRHGTVVRAGAASLKYCPNKKREHYRVAVVVSRKVSKSAVARNRIRRRIYEAVRQQLGESVGSYDLAFMIYDVNLALCDSTEITKLTKQLLKRAGIRPQASQRAIVDTKE
jgi:ribonuclease P protein component